jgi:regulatory LuxR family protein
MDPARQRVLLHDLRLFTSTFALSFWLLVAGAQPESLLKVPIHCLREVADPACTAETSMAKGASNAKIACLLSLSPKMVADYVSNILHELQVADRKEAAIHVREAGVGHYKP